MDFLHLPSVVKYSADVVWVLALICMLFLRREMIFEKKVSPFIIYTVSFGLLLLIVYLFNYQSIAYFLWGFRNNFRFYFAFLSFIFFLDGNDAEGLLKLYDFLFWINAVITVFQFVVLGYNQDNLGGLFGVERGCNAYTLAFFSIVIGKSVLSFIDKKEKAWLCFLKCGVSLIIAAMAEIKFYFIVFAVIVFTAAVITRFSTQKLILILISSGLFIVSSMIMTSVFGEGSSLSVERIWELVTAKSYSSAEDLGRFTAIPVISKNFLTEIPEKLFGMGLGNCDTSAFDVCNTPFYKTYYYLHYTWFSSAFLFLENGFIGLLIYISFFVMCFVLSRKQSKKEGTNKLFCRLSMIIAVVCAILLFYNSSLRMEVSYILFFALALPFIEIQNDASVKKRLKLR